MSADATMVDMTTSWRDEQNEALADLIGKRRTTPQDAADAFLDAVGSSLDRRTPTPILDAIADAALPLAYSRSRMLQEFVFAEALVRWRDGPFCAITSV